MTVLEVPEEVSKLVAYSRALGADALLVQGPGGNSSVKTGQVMWIKASGKWLGQVTKADFVAVGLSGLMEALHAEREPKIVALSGDDAKIRPSIETILHAVLPYKVVLHVHSVAVLACAVTADAEKTITKKLKGMHWGFVPYVKPGWALAQEVRKVWEAKPDTQIFIMQNHGLLVAAETFDEAYELIKKTEAACETSPRGTDGMQALALDPTCYAMCRAGVLYPDQAVFLGAQLIGNESEKRYRILENEGVHIAPDAPLGTKEMLECHAEILRRIPAGAGLKALTYEQVSEILDWDAEKFRQGKIS